MACARGRDTLGKSGLGIAPVTWNLVSKGACSVRTSILLTRIGIAENFEYRSMWAHEEEVTARVLERFDTKAEAGRKASERHPGTLSVRGLHAPDNLTGLAPSLSWRHSMTVSPLPRVAPVAWRLNSRSNSVRRARRPASECC